MKNPPSPPPLTLSEKHEVFKLATRSFPDRYEKEIKRGMTDIELADALKKHLGIFGGSCSPDRLSVTYQCAGLKIWGGWHIVNHVIEKPLFSGNQTIAMAREVYAIVDPEQNQISLF